jgi:Na+-transporting NADH:ubiquinone oxidoreductase subunit C
LNLPSNAKSIVFATILGVVCSVLLTTASTGLKSRQQRNVEVDRQKNVLSAFGIIKEGQAVKAERILELYRENVRQVWVSPVGQIMDEDQRGPRDMPMFTYEKGDQVQAYVVPINSRGLWGQINGYLAIENDGSTIRGFTIYQHQETPGLGGEIESNWFRRNFVGKQIVNSMGDFVSVRIARGSVEDRVPPEQRPHYVDGISGATLTGQYLTEGLRDTLRAYEPVAVQFRQKNR